MMSFNVKGGVKNAKKVYDAFSMIYRATDLGRVKSVATLPYLSTHQQQGEEGRELASLPSQDRKSTRLNSSHVSNSYAVFCLKKKHVKNKVTLLIYGSDS